MTSPHAPPTLALCRVMAAVAALCLRALYMPLTAQPTAPTARLVEDLRLDANTEDFPQISRLYVGPRGQLAVPVLHDMHVRVYDAAGNRMATVGRRGSGPGEFRFVLNAGWKGDTLWIDDIYQRRVTYALVTGEVVRTVVYNQVEISDAAAAPQRDRRNAGTMSYSPFSFALDGTTLAGAQLTRNGTAFGGRDPRTDITAVLRVEPDGTARKVLTLPDYWDPRWTMQAAGFGRRIPFTYQPQIAVSPAGDRAGYMMSVLTSATEGSFTVYAFRAKGDTLFARRFPFRGVPVRTAARDSALNALVRPPQRGSEGPADLDRQFQAVAKDLTPAVYSPVDFLLFGLDGTTWIGLRATEDGRPVLALNSAGESVGMIVIPPGFQLKQASASHAWTLLTDADGLTSIVRFRIDGIGCAPTGCR